MSVVALGAGAPAPGELPLSTSPAYATQTFGVGTLVIPMDTTSQDYGILRAYGLVYKLLANGIPVQWAVDSAKVPDGPDFTISSAGNVATNIETGAIIALPLAYAGGPFLIAPGDAPIAIPIVLAWLASDTTTVVHKLTVGSFTAPIAKTLNDRPRIAVFKSGNEDISFHYLNSAGIPDSTGAAWDATSPDLLDESEMAGPSLTIAGDGALFTPGGGTPYSHFVSMHYDASGLTDAVARELRKWLTDFGSTTHAYLQCEAIAAFENSPYGRFITTGGLRDGLGVSTAENLLPAHLLSQIHGPLRPATGTFDTINLESGSAFRLSSNVQKHFRRGSDSSDLVWISGYAFDYSGTDSSYLGVPKGQVRYLAGHDYYTSGGLALPVSSNDLTNGARFLLNSLFESAAAPLVTTHPTARVVTNGIVVNLAASATGSPWPTVSWQVSTNGGGTWTDITGAITTTYSFAAAIGDDGKLFRATFTNVWGTAVSDAALLTVVNSPPTATGVSISGTPKVGQTLTGSYTYGDVDGDAEGTSTFRWLRDGTAMGGATSHTYGIVLADLGTTLTFEVTPIAQTGTSPGAPVTSSGVVIQNSAPTASTLAIGGIPKVGQTLTGSYTYGDVDGDAEGTSTFRWLRDGTAIGGATNQTYGIVLADLGTALTFEVTPVAQTGTSPGTPVTSSGIVIQNTAPTISDIADKVVPQNGTSGPLPFTVGDLETAAGSLLLTRSSSNTTVVPTANVVFGGSGANRTVTVTPAAGQTGSATITVTVTDQGTLTATDTFLVTVIADTPPTITDIGNQTIPMNGSTGALAFTVGDAETAVGALNVTGASTNSTLVPNANITFGGSGASRTVTVTPALNHTGSTIVSVTVTDGSGLTATDTFTVAVTNTPPTISNIADQTIPKNGSSGPIFFTVGDAETAVGSLLVTSSTSTPTLIPTSNIVFGGSGANRTLTITPTADQTGTATITVMVWDSALDPRQSPAAPAMASDTFVVTVPGQLTYYLAEGATGPFFDLELALANPNDVAAPVAIQYLRDNGTTVNQPLTLAALSRETILVDYFFPGGAVAVSTIVTSTSGLPLVVERTMTWDSTGYGSHTEKATPGAALDWYFADGSEQSFFDTYLLLANPQGTANRATVVFLVEGGSPVTKVYDLLPTSRTNVFAGDVEDPPGTKALLGKAFGITVTFDQPGVAERAMYFGSSPFWDGGHESAGVNAPSTSWFLAEGATGSFFDTFILLSNPNGADATVTLTYLLDTGATVTRTKTVSANARLTVIVESEDPLLASAAMATQVTSDLPIVAERAMYWTEYPNWYEAHNAFGVTATALKWGLGEGRVGGANGYETYILLANPGATAAAVTVTFLREGGLAPIVQNYTVPATSRFNVFVNGVPGLAGGERFGALIESTVPIAVERAMYSNSPSQPDVFWPAGTNATGTPLP